MITRGKRARADSANVPQRDTLNQRPTERNSAQKTKNEAQVLVNIGRETPKRARTGRFEKNIESNNLKGWSDESVTFLTAGSDEAFLPASAYDRDAPSHTPVDPVMPNHVKKKKYIKKADRIAAMSATGQNDEEAPKEDVAFLTAGSDEAFLPASAYDRDAPSHTPVDPVMPNHVKKKKYIKKADRIAVVPVTHYSAGDPSSLYAVSTSAPKHGKGRNGSESDAHANEQTEGNVEDLGPPMPPLLIVDTTFKKRKGYYYDPILSLATPSRDEEKSKTFRSCLLDFDERTSPLLDSASKMSRTFVLQRALSIEELNDNSWLSSSLIDLVFARFARNYDTVDFLPADFAVMLSLPSSNHSELLQATDILGRRLMYDRKRPMLLLCNAKSIHWILIKIEFLPEPQLQLFEPMGQPINLKRGMSYRIVPRDVVRWLDTCCPLPDKTSWLSKAVSAITSQQQFTSFDCGVACLLYAEKCGQGETYTSIDNSTSQHDITAFRKQLQNFVSQLHFGGAPPCF